ncbi:unnamed protein product [Adineta steineri]|nr:unnamed protein product [Adineta steineri]
MSSTGYFTDPFCEIYLPMSQKWHTAATMQAGRDTYTLTVLQDGKSILAVGCSDDIDSYTVEIYDIEIDLWTFVPVLMEDQRLSHTATLLQNGQILIVGGKLSVIDLFDTSRACLYDPSSNMFIRTGSMNIPRSWHVATLLNDGLSVLVTGGYPTLYGGALPSEIYINGSWFYTNNDMMCDCTGHAAALLPDGNVLIAGGYSYSYGVVSSAILYDPATHTFSPTQSMACSRMGFTLTLLPSGQVLAAGGIGFTTDECPLVCELYDPVSGQWTSTRLLNTIRQGHAAGIINNSVILIGGYDDDGDPNNPVDQIEIYYL